MRDPVRIWEVLQEKLHNARSRNGQQSVFREFSNLQPLNADSSINEYVMRLKRCQSELRETELIINHLMVTNQILNYLLSTLNVIKRLISDKPQEVQTADHVIDKILEEERVIKGKNKSTSASGPTCNKELAATTFALTKPVFNRQASLRHRKCLCCGRSSRLVCRSVSRLPHHQIPLEQQKRRILQHPLPRHPEGD